MNKLTAKVNSLAQNPLAVPVALLLTSLLAYGLSFSRLGFYWDDLPISWIRYQLGSEATARYFSDSRPVWGWLYQITGYLLPQKPAYWQAFALFWRWAGAVVFWLALERLFPRRKYSVFLLALFFLLYPGFNQQWVSYLYAHFFIVLFFFLFSWYLMLRGQTVPAMIFSALNLLMLEYFFPLEFIRPLLIFKSLEGESLAPRSRIFKTLKIWLPYIGSVLVAVTYRVFVYSHPGFGYSLTEEFIRAPFDTLVVFAAQLFSSFWAAMIAAWLQAFQLSSLPLAGTRATLLFALVALIVGAIVVFFGYAEPRGNENRKREAFWMLSAALLLFLLGGVPFWLTNVPVSLGFPANRSTLSFMLGAAFFIAGLLELLPSRIRTATAVLLLSLSAGRQFLWSVDFARDWNAQKNLFWQMTWRAPGLEKNTVVLINEELNYYADNSLGAALNWIYAPNNRGEKIDYALFYPTNRKSLSLQPNTPLTYDFLAGKFTGNTSQTVVFYYAPPKCLRLLDPEIDSANRMIPDDTLLRDAALLSSSTLILSEPAARMPEIYYPEPAHGWCYYFQKADLARQTRDWETVAEFGEIALALDDYPNDPVERFVFIEGYAHTENWKKAVELSLASHKVSKNYVAPLLCKLWERIARETKDSPQKKSALMEMQGKFDCPP
jgi:hypothetical protein